MIKWLICRIWGHKTVYKAANGETYKATNAFGMNVEGLYYELKRSPFCRRCGKMIEGGAR